MGKVNLVGLAMLLGVAAFIYSVVVFAPYYADNLDVKEAVQSVYAQSRGHANDEVLRAVLKEKLRYVGTHEEVDELGATRTVDGLGLADEQIVIERNGVSDTILIRVEYQRKVPLKPFKRFHTLRFKVVKEGPVPKG